MEFETQVLHRPDLTEVSAVLLAGLQTLFSVVIVSVIDSPNLKEKPFMLASEGLGGCPALADIGGENYLYPLPSYDKVYSFKEITKNIVPDALIIGAGAGPVHEMGVCSELIANVKFGENALNNTYVAKIGENNECQLVHLRNSTEFCFLGQFFVSAGMPGKVIKVIAKHRRAPGNFVTGMRTALQDHYKDRTVGMGGVFVIKRGKLKFHVQSNHMDTPLVTPEERNSWLNFFNFSAPMACMSRFISHDPGLDFRLEHSHCFSDHGEGGHYYEDITPACVEYEGYFNVAERIYRFDRPSSK